MDYKTAITKERLYVDVCDIDVHNIFDASYAAYDLLKFKDKLGIKFYFKALKRALKIYRMKKGRVRGDFSEELKMLENLKKK